MDLTADFSGLFTPQSDELTFEALMDRVQELEERVAMQSIDRLTGVLSTDEFHAAVKRILKEYPDEHFVMWRFDIDKFQTVNNLFGVDEGNRLLVYCAKYLMSNVRRDRSTAVGRMGGDVFCGITPFSENAMTFGEEGNHWLTANPTIANMESFFKGFRSDFRFSVSIGFYQIEDHNDPIEILYSRALAASKSCKDHGDQIYAFYDQALNLAIEEKQIITAEMHSALENGEFTVFLQPKVRISDLSLVGAEALVRWIHPKKGRIPPDSFIPIFEENGFITKLDLYVLRRCCAYIQSWIRQGMNLIPISVNLSQMDLSTPGLPSKIQAVLEEYKVAAKYIHLEITESAYADDVEQVNGVTQAFKNLGFHLEMDDFGKGYSSLNMIAELPIDTLKLDMGFLQGDQQSSGKVISFVTSLARQMELTTVAEGIETQEQLAFLRSINCDCGQGYLFSKPLAKADFDAYMRGCTIATINSHKVKGVDKSIAQYNGWNTEEIWDVASNFSKMFNAFAGGLGVCELNMLRGTFRLARYNDLFAAALGTTTLILRHYCDNLLLLIHPEDQSKAREAINLVMDPKNWSRDTGLVSLDLRMELLESEEVRSEHPRYTWVRVKCKLADFSTETRTYVMHLSNTDAFHNKIFEMEERLTQVDDLERQMSIYTQAGIAGSATVFFPDDGAEMEVTYANRHFMELHSMGHLYDTVRFPLKLSSILPPESVDALMKHFNAAFRAEDSTFQWIIPRADNEGVVRNIMSNGRLRYEPEGIYAEVVLSSLSDASTLKSKLKMSENHSEQLLNSTEITCLDFKELKVYWGHDLQHIFGMPPEAPFDPAGGFPGAQIFHPDSVVNLERMVAELIEKEGTRTLDLWMRHENYVDFSLRRSTFYSTADEQGRIYRITGVSRDITYERFHRHNVTLAQIVSHTPDGLLVFSVNTGKLLYANETFYQIVGLTKEKMEEDFKNYPLFLVNDEDYSPDIVLPEILAGEGATFSRVNPLKNHAMRWVEFQGIRRDAYIYATVRDVTNRKTLQIQLDRETSFNEILNNIADELLFRVNIQERTVAFFGKGATTFGLAPEPMNFTVEGPAWDLVAEEYQESYRKMCRDIIAGKEEIFDIQMKNKNGKISWYRFEYRIISEAGDPAFAVGKAVNIDYQVGLLAKLERDTMTNCYNYNAMKMRSNQILNYSFSGLTDSSNEDEVDQHALLIVHLENYSSLIHRIPAHERDEIVTQAANMLIKRFRDSDLIGRIQEHSFAVFMKNLPSSAMALQKIADIYQDFTRYNAIEPEERHLKVKISCAFASKDGVDYNELLENAKEVPKDTELM